MNNKVIEETYAEHKSLDINVTHSILTAIKSNSIVIQLCLLDLQSRLLSLNS